MPWDVMGLKKLGEQNMKKSSSAITRQDASRKEILSFIAEQTADLFFC